MKYDNDAIENINSITKEEVEKMVGRDNISNEEFEKGKEVIFQKISIYNETKDIINKYGIKEITEIMQAIMDELKIYFLHNQKNEDNSFEIIERIINSDLQQRIDKAIEKIESYFGTHYDVYEPDEHEKLPIHDFEMVLSILKGENNESTK